MLTLEQAVTEALNGFAPQSAASLVQWVVQDPHRLISTVIGDVSSQFRADGQDQPYERDTIAELVRQIRVALSK